MEGASAKRAREEEREILTIIAKAKLIPPKKRIVPVIFEGHEGYKNSVTHFYHFFFAVLIPLIEYHLEHKCAGYKICTDIGPMKSILCELDLNIVEIVGSNNSKGRLDAPHFLDHVALPAYDHFLEEIYRSPSVVKLRLPSLRRVIKFFSDTAPSYIRQIPTFDIILIERTAKEKYYTEIEIEKKHKTSGAQHRVIRNHSALASALATKYGSKFSCLELERTSIYFQYHMFANAKIVIAQHGAALSNIVFMGEDGAVVEIKPPASHIRREHFQVEARTHFINLAHFMGLKHTEVHQSSDCGDVSVEVIVSAVDEYAASLDVFEEKLVKAGGVEGL